MIGCNIVIKIRRSDDNKIVKKFLKETGIILKETVKKWWSDRATQSAAAVAFYTIFSLAPLGIIVIGITGMILNEATVREQLINEVDAFIGPQGARLVRNSIQRLEQQGSGLTATVIGFVMIFFGATTIFAQLQAQLNMIWSVQAKPGKSVFSFIRSRLLSLGIILIMGFLLLVSLIIDTILSAMGSVIKNRIPGVNGVLEVLNVFGSLFIVMILFSAIFKYLPDVKLQWRDVLLGGLLTAVLFTIGKSLIGLYLGRSAVVSAYGAAGSLVIILLWVYYSTQILFLGAEFTQVYATHRGHAMPPDDHAEKIG